ncbi:hypothetical protein Hypma_016520 [Hypsizygus marmoreus]|uniref:Uncharacterized protein n=1 Tax=Hypsizygus marmoreus TaxID=39966 RepID=A0A369J7J0_HYPMA|nr:hypothetical protein Hypma_016520 [Hypsizygus marmoreus]
MRFLNACKRALKSLLRKEPRTTNNNNDRPIISVPLPIGTTPSHNAHRRRSGRRQRSPDHADFAPQTSSHTQGLNVNHHVSSTVSNVSFNVNSNIQRRAEVLHYQDPREAEPFTSQVTHSRVTSTNNAQASSSRHGTHFLQTENAPRRHGLSAIGNLIGISTARGASHSRQVAPVPAPRYTNARGDWNQPSTSSGTVGALHDQNPLPAGSSHTRYWHLPPIPIQPPITLPEYPSDGRSSRSVMFESLRALSSARRGDLGLGQSSFVDSRRGPNESFFIGVDFSFGMLASDVSGMGPDHIVNLGSYADMDPPEKPITNDNIRNLEVTTRVDPHLYLDHLALPNLQTFSLTWNCQSRESLRIPDSGCIGFTDFILRSKCRNLTSVTLENICPAENDLVEFLRIDHVRNGLQKIAIRADLVFVQLCGRERRRVTDKVIHALHLCKALGEAELSYCDTRDNILADLVENRGTERHPFGLKYSFLDPSRHPSDMSRLSALAGRKWNQIIPRGR